MGYPYDQGAESQAANLFPPEDVAGTSSVLPFKIDNTSRRKDLSQLPIHGKSTTGGRYYLTLVADQKWWYRLSDDPAAVVDETAITAVGVAAGGTDVLAFVPNGCIEIQALQPTEIPIIRDRHKYLVIKGSVNPTTVRGFISSDLRGDK